MIKPWKKCVFYKINYLNIFKKHFILFYGSISALLKWWTGPVPKSESQVFPRSMFIYWKSFKTPKSIKSTLIGIFYHHFFLILGLFNAYSTIMNVTKTLFYSCALGHHLSSWREQFNINIKKVDIKVIVSWKQPVSALFMATQSNLLWQRQFVDVPVWQLCFWVSLSRRSDPHTWFLSLSRSTSSTIHPLFLPSSPGVSLCLCLSPVSCALFQGWGLRHTFHLAYEALILFRGCSGSGERTGQALRGGGERGGVCVCVCV